MPLRIWIEKTERASWTNFAEVRQTFGSADQVGNNRVIFNVGGNKFRLVAAIGYKTGFVLLKFVGTHKQYDRIDPEVIEVKDWK